MVKVLYTLLYLLPKVGLKSSNQTEAFDLRDTLVRLPCRVGVLFGQLFQCQLMVANQF